MVVVVVVVVVIVVVIIIIIIVRTKKAMSIVRTLGVYSPNCFGDERDLVSG